MTKPTLYHCNDARSFRCVWAAEAVGLDYTLETMPFPPRFHVPAYKQINPLGTIPCWVDGDINLTESAAICQIMAHGTSLEILPDEGDYPAYLNWLHRSDATLTFPLAIMLRYSVFPNPRIVNLKLPRIISSSSLAARAASKRRLVMVANGWSVGASPLPTFASAML